MLWEIGTAMWCPHVPSSHIYPNLFPSLLQLPLPEFGLDAINTSGRGQGERGRWVRHVGRGQTGYNLELSYWFNKRLKVQPCCSNSYHQLLLAVLSLVYTPCFSKRLPVLCRTPSVSIQFLNYFLYVLPINCLE